MKRDSCFAPALAVSFLVLALSSCGDDGCPCRQVDGPRDNVTAHEVPLCFRYLEDSVREGPDTGSTDRYLGANNDKTLIPWPTFSILGNVRYHMQGVQRYGNYLIVSAGIGDGEEMSSQLIVIRMGSRSATGAWSEPYGNEAFNYETPSPLDAVVRVIRVDRSKWHAGGIQMAGPVLGVPVYGDGESAEIRFYDFSNPEAPVALEPITVVCPRDVPARAVGLTRLPDRRYMLLVWDDHNLYFYRSRSADLHQGFDDARYTVVPPDDVIGGFQTEGSGPFGFSTYQNITFVSDGGQDAYFVATRNTQAGAPVLPGKDFATLYRVSWPGRDYDGVPAITNLESKRMNCYDGQCSFTAGADVYVDGSGALFLYAVPHYLHDFNNRINFNEYVSRVPAEHGRETS